MPINLSIVEGLPAVVLEGLPGGYLAGLSLIE
jgi:hypothetical protein